MLRSIALLCMLSPLFGAVHTLTVCVKDEKGAPVPAAVVRINELEGAVRFTATTDVQGCYKRDIVPDGAYEIRAEQNGVEIAKKQIVLHEKQHNATVDLQYRPISKPAPAGEQAPPMINLQMLSAATPSSGISGNRQSDWIQSVTFNVKRLESGEPGMGKVTLAKPAPEAGILVHLSVSNSALAEVPPEITIGKGLTGGWFPIKTSRLRGPSDVNLKVTASDGESNQSAELPILSFTRVTVRMVGDGAGLVVSSPQGIRCFMGVCSEPFRDGESVQFTAQADAGSEFEGWSLDCNKDGAVVVTGSMHCIATFARK